MFRWLKDRGRKGRKPSTDSKLSLEGVRSKEDDYGFKQKQQQQQQGGGGGVVGEYKRDLPPTPADLMTSCSVTDDDKSFHIYEEIPDLPFRCTPEGELRFTLAKEEASRRRRGSSRAGSPHSAASLPGSQGPRNISPYMVVPLERLGGTPSEFRGHNDSSEFRGHNDSSEFRGHNDSSEFRARTDAPEFRGHNDSSEIRGSRDGSSFACALVGRKMPDGYPESGAVTAASPGCESASQGTSTPSCCGSSVFGSPLEVAGRCGCAVGDGVDMSDRLLSAINLTRLLAAVRLSSSSADTCTTSPICIGVDKDGRNISVSVSVTPTTPTNNNNNNVNHNEDNNGDDDDQKTAGESASSKTETGSADPQDHFVSEAETGSTATRESGSNSSSSPPETGSTSTRGAKTGFVAKSEAGLTPINNNSNNSSNSNKGQSGMSSVQPTQTGLRFLPSPLEQTALSEILQLRPGESTELDPATIDAIILRLCSHTLQVEGQGQDDGRSSSSAATAAGLAKPLSSSALQRQELEDVERMLKEMVRAGEDDVVVSGGGGGVRGRASAKHHHHNHHNHRHKQSPAARRAENSDTGFEYDVSTSSESDHTNYDYFLSKVARTRSLECEVKKMLRSSDSSRCESDYDDDDDGEEEEEEEEEEREEKEEGVSGARESISSSTTTGSSTISQTSQTRRKRERLTPEVDAATDSDDGTMADLSESENSSGYYESAPGKPVEPFPATSAAAASASAAARAKSRSGKSASSGKKKAGRGEETGGDVEVQCYELDCSGGEAERGDFFPATGAGYSSSSGSIATATATAAAAPACSPSQSRRATAAAPDCLSGVTAEGSSSRPPHHPKTGRGRCSGGCKKPHHKHHHHHHHHRSSSDVNGGREGKRGESGKSAKKPSGVGGEDGSGGGGGSLDASGSSHARSLSLCDRGAGTRTRDCRRGSADAVGADSPNLSRPKSDKDDSNNKKGSNTNSKRSKDATYAKTALKPTDYPYSLLYPTPTPASTPSSNGANHSRSHPKTAKGSKKAAVRGNAGLERAASFHSEQSPAESVYESRRQASEVYSIPAALPDPSPTPGGGGGGVRGLKGSASVPSKLSVARQVPESSEVYGTRAGLRRCSNRLLSDLIMLNYNRQVLNM